MRTLFLKRIRNIHCVNTTIKSAIINHTPFISPAIIFRTTSIFIQKKSKFQTKTFQTKISKGRKAFPAQFYKEKIPLLNK